jgi:hypothetical protein
MVSAEEESSSLWTDEVFRSCGEVQEGLAGSDLRLKDVQSTDTITFFRLDC